MRANLVNFALEKLLKFLIIFDIEVLSKSKIYPGDIIYGFFRRWLGFGSSCFDLSLPSKAIYAK